MSTARDKSVLNMILNPFMPTSSYEDMDSINNDDVITTDSIASLSNFNECETLEVEGVKFAEMKDFTSAFEKFSTAIQLCPENPSPYNNRAQVYRLQEKIDEAMADLNKAIALCEEESRRREKRIVHIAAQAYVQRALVNQLCGKEDETKADYEQAAARGSTFAKTQLVALNPYAAMCNKMLREVMTKLQTGES